MCVEGGGGALSANVRVRRLGNVCEWGWREARRLGGRKLRKAEGEKERRGKKNKEEGTGDVSDITNVSKTAGNVLNKRRAEVVNAVEAHLNSEAALKLISECMLHDRNAVAAPAIANSEEHAGYSATRFLQC